MKGLPGYFIGIILLLLLSLMGTSLVTGSIAAENARNFHASAVSQIENSNYNPEVISSLYREADRLGYELEPVEVREIIPNRRMCEVVVKYTYSVGILDVYKRQLMNWEMSCFYSGNPPGLGKWDAHQIV